MRTSDTLQSIKNFVAPEVSVAQEVACTASHPGRIMARIVEKYGLFLIHSKTGEWKLQFAGSSVVTLNQSKIVLGISPDLVAYEHLHSYITVRSLPGGKLSVRSHERIIAGMPAEQKVYRTVLQNRLDRFIAFLNTEKAAA